MIPVDVRRLTATDVDVLAPMQEQLSVRWAERLASQDRGEFDFFVAWRDDEPLGRVILRPWSAYPSVRKKLGDFPEINGLVAEVRNQGVGTQIIAACERHAGATASIIGMGVGLGNVDAQRLYARLGYVEWHGGAVTAEWQERNAVGKAIASHREEGRYLTKRLG